MPKITAIKVNEAERLAFLPKHFGNYYLEAEMQIYDLLNTICDEYEGGYWEFYELSNGGFYLAPQIEKLLRIEIPTNCYQGKVSADAAGIIATICVINDFCWKLQSDDFIDKFYLLREFAIEHAEHRKILGTIDYTFLR